MSATHPKAAIFSFPWSEERTVRDIMVIFKNPGNAYGTIDHPKTRN
jgi:hypothetical protein